MCSLSSSQKGAAAEAEVIAALIRMNHLVLKPLVEGGRYDLAVDLGYSMLRVQCKWAARGCSQRPVCDQSPHPRRLSQAHL
jgi:hypothetical protein